MSARRAKPDLMMMVVVVVDTACRVFFVICPEACSAVESANGNKDGGDDDCGGDWRCN